MGRQVIYVDQRGRVLRGYGGAGKAGKGWTPGGVLAAGIGITVGVALASSAGHGHAATPGTARAPAAIAAVAAPGPLSTDPPGTPWSVFTRGGGISAAVAWAKDLLGLLGVPQSAANARFIYDWELSEGGGGKYNPLNQGPVPGQPGLTSTGPQYGGGAADFVSWQAGLAGSVAYLHMPAYAGVLAALRRSDYQGAASALWASPWADSHYGYGAAWRTAALGNSK
jgi:hypothetical protein